RNRCCPGSRLPRFSRSSPCSCGGSPDDRSRSAYEVCVIDLDVHLAAIVAGDTRAFGRWLAGAEAPVRDSLRSFARVVDVEAVLQEALLRVWQVAPRFEPDGRPNGLLRLG